ncbi:hypothetical protein ACQR1Y_03600 [Bradyrhizobium sp. HKCCYLRH3099]|uniref:hypothetical protein n=1 Tax=unclassified Bradyrhizobium TaxID=2631580 RepID=UPI003EBF2AB7
MNTLKTALPNAFPDIRKLSGEGRTIDRDRLMLVLDGLARNLKRAYWIRLSIGALVFALLLFLVFKNYGDTRVLTATIAATGVTVGGTITALRQVTEEMARVGLLLAIAPELSVEALTELANTIAAKL